LFQAGKLALERGWSINVGGGFHHCSSDRGGGFCAYADLTLLIKNLFIHHPDRVKKVLIVDLDAHQVKNLI
jgi:histone deacetylase 11